NGHRRLPSPLTAPYNIKLSTALRLPSGRSTSLASTTLLSFPPIPQVSGEIRVLQFCIEPAVFELRFRTNRPSSRLLQGVLRLHRRHQLHLPKSSPAGAHSSSHFATAAVDPAAAAAGSSSPPPSSLPRPFPLSYPPSSAAGSARNSCQSRAFGNLAASEVLLLRAGQASSKSFSPAGLGPLRLNCYGVRHFSFQSSGNGGFAKKIFEKPTMSVLSAFSKYREAIGLQVESFLRSNYLILVGAAAVLVCALLWRIMFGIGNTFVGISEGMAKYGFLALSSAIVTFAVSS
ncbi:hypothetical protein ACJRO7_029199, partial [Eucalyptus globulus]